MHQLGLLTYAEFEAMPASEIDRWRQFFAEEPAGYHAENRRAGIVVATLLNVGLGIKRERQIKPSQIFPADRPPQKLKPAEPKAAQRLMASLRGAF